MHNSEDMDGAFDLSVRVALLIISENTIQGPVDAFLEGIGCFGGKNRDDFKIS